MKRIRRIPRVSLSPQERERINKEAEAIARFYGPSLPERCEHGIDIEVKPCPDCKDAVLDTEVQEETKQ